MGMQLGEKLTFECPRSARAVPAQRLATNEQSVVTSWMRSTLPCAVIDGGLHVKTVAPPVALKAESSSSGRRHPLKTSSWSSDNGRLASSLGRSGSI